MGSGSVGGVDPTDAARMQRALDLAATVRARTPPNPWVGCVLVAPDGTVVEGATEPAGGRHAEVVALDAAGDRASGSTVYVSLEPCAHQGRTAPCVDALIAARVARVVVALTDPDPRVAGRGVAALGAAGIRVDRAGADESARAEEVLAPYLTQRRTGRPHVVCKLAATLDGRIAAPDGTSQWITGPDARRDAHGLRAESEVIVVGAGTVRADDPSLTVRLVDAPRGDPRRIVLGTIPPGAKVLPATEHHGPVEELLDTLGAEGVLQVLIEGGAGVAHGFHSAGLVDRYVLYLAPALFGGSDAPGLFAGPGATTMAELWRGRIDRVERLGEDVRVDLVPRR